MITQFRFLWSFYLSEKITIIKWSKIRFKLLVITWINEQTKQKANEGRVLNETSGQHCANCLFEINSLKCIVYVHVILYMLCKYSIIDWKYRIGHKNNIFLYYKLIKSAIQPATGSNSTILQMVNFAIHANVIDSRHLLTFYIPATEE